MENSSIFKPYQQYQCCRGEKQVILKNSIGRQLPYIVNIRRNACQIFDIEWERITHAYEFPDSCQIVDVDYFPTKDGKLGILVGVVDQKTLWGAESYVVALLADATTPTMRIVKSQAIPSRITVVKTLFTEHDMVERRAELGLYYRLMEWEHVVAIGCKNAQCFLTRLTASENPPKPSAPPVEPPFQINEIARNRLNLMGHYSLDGDVFAYTQEDGLSRDYPLEDVHVTALCVMPRSRTLLVGLSMGGILAASLNASNEMKLLDLRHERPIRKIACLEPEDDPDRFEYFMTAVDRSPRHPIMIQLYRGSFKTHDEVEGAEKYDRPHFTVCLEHRIPFGERWIAMHSIVTDRSVTERPADSSSSSSLLNTSQSFGAAANRSSVVLAYERRTSSGDDAFCLEASIFDIDAWYYKRVPGRVFHDGTSLKQCAFMSTVRSDDFVTRHTHDVAILTLDATDVTRFASLISDADPLFYPSALSFDRVFVVEEGTVHWMKIQNVQETILAKCAANLPYFIENPQSMADDILAAGLVRKSILSGSPNSSAVEPAESSLSTHLKVVLSAMVYYGKVEEMCDLVRRAELGEPTRREIAEWALHEAVDFKRAISDKTAPLFQRRTLELSPVTEDALLQGVKLFRVVYEVLKTCSRGWRAEREKCAKWHNLAHSIKCMRNHTKLVSRFIAFGLVPENAEVHRKMREEHEKRTAVARRNGTALPITIVCRQMHRLAADAQFWNETPHDQWYPPTPLDVLESLLNVSIPERMKRELIVQYVLDWLRVQQHPEHQQQQQDEQRRRLAIETIKVMSDQMLEVDTEKVQFVLESEQKALEARRWSTTTTNDIGQKVFSLRDEHGMSYQKLWNGDISLETTIGKGDMERFAMRLKMQSDKGRAALPPLDPESEMLYQVYLFESEKYEMMSPEAVEANELLRMGLPVGTLRSRAPSLLLTKSRKEREIEQSVRRMFERNAQREAARQHDDEDVEKDEFFVRMARKEGGQDDDDVSSCSSAGPYVPPTAKRIPHRVTRVTEDESSITSPTHADPKRDAEINALIATPARYYKRPGTGRVGVDDDDVATEDVVGLATSSGPTTPSAAWRFAPAPTQNSILKTAKAVQSASRRGRIRFHESVRKGETSSSSTEDVPDDDDDDVVDDVDVDDAVPRRLDFTILEDDEEEETLATRKSRKASSESPEYQDASADAGDVAEEDPQESEYHDCSDEGVPGVIEQTTELQEEPEEVELERTFEVQSDDDLEPEQKQAEPEPTPILETSLEIQEEQEPEPEPTPILKTSLEIQEEEPLEVVTTSEVAEDEEEVEKPVAPPPSPEQIVSAEIAEEPEPEPEKPVLRRSTRTPSRAGSELAEPTRPAPLRRSSRTPSRAPSEAKTTTTRVPQEPQEPEDSIASRVGSARRASSRAGSVVAEQEASRTPSRKRSASVIAAPEDVGPAEVVTPKRGRGRPRKHPLPEAGDTSTPSRRSRSASTSSTTAAVTPRRGRPPVLEEIEEEEQAETPSLRRSTRRPTHQ